jgi:hypothetical protein
MYSWNGAKQAIQDCFVGYVDAVVRTVVQLPLREFEAEWLRILDQTMERFRKSMVELVATILLMIAVARYLNSNVSMTILICCTLLVSRAFDHIVRDGDRKCLRRTMVVTDNGRDSAPMLLQAWTYRTKRKGDLRKNSCRDASDGPSVWWESMKIPNDQDPAGVERDVSLWHARRTRTDSVTVFGTVRGVSHTENLFGE